MKKLLFLLSFSLSTLLFAQKPAFFEAKLESATIYFSGAELLHGVNVNLNKGTNEIVIKNVAERLFPNSIQILAPKNVTVMSSQFTRSYINEYEIDETSPATKRVLDSILIIQKEIQKTLNKKNTEQRALKILETNEVLSGKETGLSVAELAKLIEFYTAKYNSILENIDSLTEKETKLQETKKKLEARLEINTSKEEKLSNGKIVLQVMSDVAQKIDLKVSYITPNASWHPFYDLRAENTNKPIDLIYKALATQTTGIDWKNIKLSLSSGMPNQNNEITLLTAWYLRFGRENSHVSYAAKKSVARNVYQAEATKDYSSAQVAEVKMERSSVNDYTEMAENQLNVSFDIDIPYSIASNGKEHSVSLKELKLPAKYHYYTAPRAENEVFLVAEVENYSQYNLLQGEANIIFEGMYVGKTNIDPNQTNEVLPVSMGRDKKISIKREKITDKSGTKFLSGYQEQTFTYDITIRNNKKETANITVKDQYPLSTDKEITVELLQHSGAKNAEEKGILTWEINLKPNETKQLRISYKVKYPRNRVISNL
ncbi:MAG: DUF4139 domain-containing protein [Capnocytophaga sp.]|nr:DUF4139 domain-containing protein [Capnocytophaga sp.]